MASTVPWPKIENLPKDSCRAWPAGVNSKSAENLFHSSHPTDPWLAVARPLAECVTDSAQVVALALLLEGSSQGRHPSRERVFCGGLSAIAGQSSSAADRRLSRVRDSDRFLRPQRFCIFLCLNLD